MDKIAQPLDKFLQLASQSALLVSQADKANLDVLLTMLGPVDKDIIVAYYGLFGSMRMSAAQLAAKYRITPEAILDIITKDLSITPEWQMMLRQLSPMVRRRIIPKE